MVVEDVDRLRAEAVDDAVCEDGADAADEPAREVAAHALDGLRRNAFDGLRLELAPAHGVVDPLPRRMQLLAFPGGRAGSQDGDLARGEAECPVRLGGGDVENGEARLVVPEHDGLDGAVDRLHLHAVRHRSRYFASGFGASAATWTFLMTTGSSGTFWWGPAKPVFTFAILSTTSMPSVTRPNTA